MVEYYHENYDADILYKYLSRIDLDYVEVEDAYGSLHITFLYGCMSRHLMESIGLDM